MSDTSRREFLTAVPLALTAASAAPAISESGRDERTDYLLWYRQPAKVWTEALPVGNGRLGAMVFGETAEERIQLNEDTLWSGAPSKWNNPDASKALPEIRHLVLEEAAYRQADTACKKMQGTYNESYLPAAELLLQTLSSANASGYRRELNLDTAIATTSFRAGGGSLIRREVFSSAVDQILAVRIESSDPGQVDVIVSLESLLHSDSQIDGSNTLRLMGKAPSHVIPNYVKAEPAVFYSEAEGKGMRYECWVRIIPDGGRLSRVNQSLHLQNANAVTLLLTIATGFKSFDQDPSLPASEIAAVCRERIDAAAKKSYAQLRADHIQDHRRLFRRVFLALGSHAASDLPTDERLKAFPTNPADQQFLALYFQYGRYLLITSSRPGTQPANLQGIWNPSIRPPWSCNWTANINIQMNYWLAETCNLSECHEPLFNLVEGLSKTGRQTAEINYQAPGWVSHHNIDLWRQSAPVGDFGKGDPTWANWQMSGPWLCAHLWEHYRFTCDKKFLQTRAYPLMKGSAEFYLSWLIDDKKGGLTTCPSFSTENNFKTPDGQTAETSAGCTMDVALIRELFRNCIQAATVLNRDQDFVHLLRSKLAMLPSYKIGRFGQLQEWSQDFEEATPGQRHMSHLYPLYPGDEFTARRNQEFWHASQVSLERRLAAGGGYTGWSRAWVICLWARLENGNLAHESLTRLMEHSTGPNLFDTHPAPGGAIFQIDGNFGAPAGLAELLLQSHEEIIHILPALPTAWPEGKVTGLRARGGVEVDIAWSEGRAKTMRLQPSVSGRYKVRSLSSFKVLSPELAVPLTKMQAGLTELRLEAGRSYQFTFL